jgi:hypothetical protein
MNLVAQIQNSPADKTPAQADAGFTPARFGWVLALLIAASFADVLFGTGSFFFRDYGAWGYPTYYYHHECFWQGETPLWNPLSHCGLPFVAQWSSLCLYPFSLFYLLFPLPWSLGFFCLGHLFLAGMGMYRLAYGWTNNRFAASAAGIAFVFNGVMFSSLSWPHYIVALGWMPWLIWHTERAWRNGGRSMVGAALVGMMQMMSGAPEIILMTWGFVLAVWTADLISGRWPRGILVRRLGGVVVWIIGLSAVQLFPFFDLLHHAQRTPNYDGRWAMPGWGWANLLVPLFHCQLSPQGIFYQSGQQFLTSYYLGSGVLVLATGAAWQARQSRAWILLGTAWLGLILALGRDGYLYTMLEWMVPSVSYARFTIKAVTLTAFAAPLLLAFALDWRLENSAGRKRAEGRRLAVTGMIAVCLVGAILWFAWAYPFPGDQWAMTLKNAVGRVVFLGLCLGIAGALAVNKWPAARLALQLGLVAVLVVDILTHAPHLAPRIASGLFVPGLWSQTESGPPPRFGESRAMITPAAESILLHSHVQSFDDDFIGKRLGLWANLNLLDAIPKVDGGMTLQIDRQFDIERLLFTTSLSRLAPLLDFLGVSRMSAPGKSVEWQSRSSGMPLITTGQKPVFADRRQTLVALAEPGFVPRTTVYLPIEARSIMGTNHSTDSAILRQAVAEDRIDVELKSSQPCLLVIAQTYYHLWQARIDGKPARIWPANHAFQALEVPAGQHVIHLRYNDWIFKTGLLVSLASGLAGAVAWWRCRECRSAPAKKEKA